MAKILQNEDPFLIWPCIRDFDRHRTENSSGALQFLGRRGGPPPMAFHFSLPLGGRLSSGFDDWDHWTLEQDMFLVPSPKSILWCKTHVNLKIGKMQWASCGLFLRPWGGSTFSGIFLKISALWGGCGRCDFAAVSKKKASVNFAS